MNDKKSQLHFKLYITMIFSVVIAIIMTSSILYVNFQSILLKHEYNSKLEKMESEATQITKLSNIALNTVNQIYNDISVKKLLTYDDIDIIEENTAFIQLRYYLSTISNIDSIYLYNTKNNIIYSVTNEARLVRSWSTDYDKNDNDFFDKSAAEMINNCFDYPSYIPFPRFYQVNSKYEKCVYSYIMYNYNTFNSNNRSYVVMLNLDSEYLFQSNKDDLNSISLVIDQYDNIVYSNADRFQVTGKLQDNFDPEDKIKKDESGYFITDINGIKSVIIYTNADKHHWRYISIIEYNTLLARVNKIQTICIIMTILIALVGFIAAYIFSRRLSIPIKTMSDNMKNLQSENRQLEKLSRNRKVIELLENNGLDNNGNRKTGTELLTLIGMKITLETNFILICIYSDRYKSLLEKYGTLEVQAYKFAAYNILSELMGEKAKTYYVDIGDDKSLVFMDADGVITKEYLEAQIIQMQKHMNNYFEVSMSVIVDSMKSDPESLYSIYEEMEEALSGSIFFEEGCCIYLSELKVNKDCRYEYPDQKEKYLMESLMLGKADEAKKIYEDIIIETYQYPIIIYNMVISRLIFAIENVVSVIRKNGLETSFSGNLILSNLMNEADKIEARNKKFYELFDRIQKEMENRKSDKPKQIVEKINSLLETGYNDSSFSLDYLASSIGISTAYMCRIYKQHTGNTINDILASIRMNKAKELLVGTQMSVNEIAEKVGYANTTYFYRIFKKENGVTPNEYRRK